jgi:lysophospholipase L1-like esterase
VRRAGLLACLLLLALPAAAGARVLVVGDSLEVGTAPYLRDRLKGVEALAVDARVGRPSPEGLRVLREKLRPEDDVVVFDLGTNDGSPALLAADLAGAAATVGPNRCLVVSSIVRPGLGGPLTGAITKFAATHPQVQVVPWRETVAGSTGVIRGDGVHATPQGYALRARLVAATIQSCLLSNPIPAPSPTAKYTPLPTPAAPAPKRPAGPPGFRPAAFDRYLPLLSTIAAGAVIGPPSDGLTIVTR